MNLPPPTNYFEYSERVRCLCVLHDLSRTSGGRTAERNKDEGGDPDSKHLWEWGGMADDLGTMPRGKATPYKQKAVLRDAKKFGLWGLWHKGHFHVQGIAPGTKR